MFFTFFVPNTFVSKFAVEIFLVKNHFFDIALNDCLYIGNYNDCNLVQKVKLQRLWLSLLSLMLYKFNISQGLILWQICS